MLRWTDRLSRAIAAALTTIFALRLLQAIPAHSLWLDEWITLEFAFTPTSWVERLVELSGPAETHFPTFYLVTRWLGELLAFPGQPVEWLVRLPVTLLVIAAVALAVGWATLPAERSPTAPWIGAAVVGILSSTGGWAGHAGEGRPYVLLGALAVAMAAAAVRGRVVAACVCGLCLVLVHPFGALVGFAPALAVLASPRLGLAERMGVDRRRVRRTAWQAGVVLLLAALWVQIKFVGHQTAGYGLRRRGGDMTAVLAGLDLRVVLPFCAVTAAGVLVLVSLVRRRESAGPGAAATFAALTAAAASVTLGLGVAALALVRPGMNVAMPRYVAWIVPGLAVGAASGLALFLDALARRLGGGRRERWLAGLGLAGALLAGAWSLQVLRTTPMGPTWADGLREAALYVDRAAGPETAVVTDSRELMKLFPPWDDGYPCPRSPQLVPYLSPAARARVACQGPDGRVVFGPEIREVLRVREPIAVLGERTVVLDGFREAGKLQFGNVTLERYLRSP